MVRYYAVHKFFNTGESDVSGNTLQEGLEFPSAQEINPAHVLKFLEADKQDAKVNSWHESLTCVFT